MLRLNVLDIKIGRAGDLFTCISDPPAPRPLKPPRSNEKLRIFTLPFLVVSY